MTPPPPAHLHDEYDDDAGDAHPLREADDDRALLRRLLADDAAAWRELVRRYAGPLLAAAQRSFRAYGFAASAADLEDAVAEVWQNLLERDRRVLHTCLELDNLWPTLQVLVRHRSVDLMRKRRVHTLNLADQQLEFVSPPAGGADADDPFTAEELSAALTHLTERQRVLVKLFFLQRQSYRQISDLTGIPQNSIGPTLARALQRLRTILEPSTPAPPAQR